MTSLATTFGTLLHVLLIATVFCRSLDSSANAASTAQEGDLRILGPSGRLQIYFEGKWGTICDDYFDDDSVAVACRQLGFNDTHAHMLPIRQDEDGMGEILLDDVVCMGEETRILSCDYEKHGLWDSIYNCRHTEDVAISCEPYKQDIRLSGGDGSQGRLEVFYEGKWGTVCNSDGEFTVREAKVACGQLGFTDMSQVQVINTVSGELPNVEQIWISDVYCGTDDSNIYDCFHTRWGSNIYCSHSQDVFISCGKGPSEKEDAQEELKRELRELFQISEIFKKNGN